MFNLMQQLMQQRLALLQEGRCRELSGLYLYPCPVYLSGIQHVMHGRKDMEQALSRLAQQLCRTGVVRMEATLAAVELPRQGRFRVWVNQRSLAADGSLVNRAAFVHYCRQTEAGVMTEMAEYPECREAWVVTEPRRALG